MNVTDKVYRHTYPWNLVVFSEEKIDDEDIEYTRTDSIAKEELK